MPVACDPGRAVNDSMSTSNVRFQRRRVFRRGITSGVAALLCAGLAVWSEQAVAQGGSCVASTAYGDVLGVRGGGTCTYLGVPFGAPPVGPLRWRPPQPRAPWSPAVLNATVAPPACPQITPASVAAGNEDCLMLNIWAPATVPPGGSLPVLVWLPAGGFLGASANFAPNDGRRFAEERNAVVVATNYRLGPFGWLAAQRARSLEDPAYPSSGDYGLADQRAALRWVRDNISAFGGDPAAVTARRRLGGQHQHRPASGLAAQSWTLSARDHAEWRRDGAPAVGR